MWPGSLEDRGVKTMNDQDTALRGDGGVLLSPEDMTIEDAQKQYETHGALFYSDDAALVDVIQRTAWDEALSNHSYLHALSLTNLMFNRTTRAFLMLTGSAGDGFVNCLRDSFVKMLRRIRAKDGVAKVIVVNPRSGTPNVFEDIFCTEDDCDFLEIVEGQAGAKARIKHFIACDDRMLRDEKYHPPLDGKMKASLVSAKVFFHNKILTTLAQERFNTIWGILKPGPHARR